MRFVAVVAAVLVLAAPASAASVDQRSTHRFVAASVTALSGAIAAHGRIAPAVDVVIARVVSGCPGALAATGEPTAAQDRTRDALFNEAYDAVSLAFLAPVRSEFPTFARGVGRLHWTLHSLDRAVATSVRGGLGLLALVPPDVCADIAAAAASGFAAIPAGTTAFDDAVASLLRPGPTPVDLAGRMRRYVGPRDRAAIRHLDRLSRRLDVLVSRQGSAPFDRIRKALG
jgi:hypothetical protein